MLTNRIRRGLALAGVVAAVGGAGLAVQSGTQAAEATTITCHLVAGPSGWLYWSCTNPGCRVGSPC